MNAGIFDLGTGNHIGDACEHRARVLPQQTVRARVHLQNVAPGLATDVVHTFTAVFGAVGEVTVP